VGAKIIVCQNGKRMKGRVLKVANKKKKQYFIKVTGGLPRTFGPRNDSKTAFGYFDFVGARITKNIIHSKSCDNLVSVALLLNLLKNLKQSRGKTNVVCLFTRAEEVGFVGTVGIIKKKWLSKNTPILVLEASSAKAGNVGINKGPVIRVGDKATTFSPEMDLWLMRLSHKLSQKIKGPCFRVVVVKPVFIILPAIRPVALLFR